MRTFIAFHDPWDALCLARSLPGVPVASFGGPAQARAFADAGVPALLVDPPDELRTLDLLADERVAAAIAEEPSLLLCFKPSARLEARARELGAALAFPPARVAQGLENKLALSALAEEAGVHAPRQAAVRIGRSSWSDLTDRFGSHFVAQSPRGHGGKKSWTVRSEADWSELEQQLAGRTVRVAEWIEGRPGTVGAVVDESGEVLVTAPIVQVTGDPTLTLQPLGSTGNDFSWRPQPHPGSSAAELAERLGPVLAGRGFRGHFGIDFVFDGSDCMLIEVNARLTASFALYVGWEPRLLRAHLAAVRGEPMESGRLEAVPGGQLILHNVSSTDAPPLDESEGSWPQPGGAVAPGARRGRRISRGEVVSASGELSSPAREFAEAALFRPPS